jgi:hypothetical protein
LEHCSSSILFFICVCEQTAQKIEIMASYFDTTLVTQLSQNLLQQLHRRKLYGATLIPPLPTIPQQMVKNTYNLKNTSVLPVRVSMGNLEC